MLPSAFVRARIDEHLKDEATAVLTEIGLTVSDLVRMALTRVAKDKARDARGFAEIGGLHQELCQGLGTVITFRPVQYAPAQRSDVASHG